MLKNYIRTGHNVFDLIRIAREHHCMVDIVTNGTQLTPERCDQIVSLASNKYHVWKILWGLFTHLKQHHYDIVHLHLQVLEKHVFFLVSRDDLLNFFHAADLVVNSSIFEEMGVIVYQAMAYGKAVVGFNAGSADEVVVDGETGLLVPVRDYNIIERQRITRAICNCRKKTSKRPFFVRRKNQTIRGVVSGNRAFFLTRCYFFSMLL